METNSPTTTAGHSAFQKLISMISLYFGLAMIAHQNPELTGRRTNSMTIPVPTTKDDDNNNFPTANESIIKNLYKQQIADPEQGANLPEIKTKNLQFPTLTNDISSRYTADDKWCTHINEGKIHDKKKIHPSNSFTPVVVIQVEKFEDPQGSSILIKSHGAAEFYETVHPRPWDVWLMRITDQNNSKGSLLKHKKDLDNISPRDTPATEVQALVAKWLVQRIVRDNRVAVSPRRLLSGQVLLRPWDRWKHHVCWRQKAGSKFTKEGSSWPRLRPRVKLRINQNATGDESEAGPPSSQQSDMNKELARKGFIQQDPWPASMNEVEAKLNE